MEEAARNKLWESYSKDKDTEVREKLIIEYAPLVKIIAGKLSMYLGYNVEYDDLVSYGIFGLIDAIDKFDYDKGIKFETYGSLRIRGSILDQIRKMDWLPRSLRQKQKNIDAAFSKLETELGRVATDGELAKELEISVQEFYVWQSQTKVSRLMSLDDYVEQGAEIASDGQGQKRFDGPEEVVESKETSKLLEDSLRALTEREKKVILLYYYEELNLKEISKVMEVSESRISQLHTRALQKLRQRLGNEADIIFLS